MSILFHFTDLETMILKSSTWAKVITMYDVADNGAKTIHDLTDHTARMQIRESVDSSTTLLELTTENGRISIDTDEGSITLTISATDTASITWTRGVYDLLLINGTEVTRLLQGAIEASEGTTELS